MKHLKKFLAAACCLFLSITSNAQVKVGSYEDPRRIEVGVHISPMISLADVKGLTEEPMQHMVADAGITLDFLDLDRPWRFGTGLTYIRRSFTDGWGYWGPSYNEASYTGKFKALEVPVFASIRFHETPKMGTYFKVGLLCDFLLSHERQEYPYSNSTYGAIEKTYGTGNLDESGYKVLNFGFHIGASSDYALSEKMVLGWEWALTFNRFKNSRPVEELSRWFPNFGLRLRLAYNIFRP